MRLGQRIAEAHARALVVLVNEDDPGRLQGRHHGLEVFAQPPGDAFGGFHPLDGIQTDARSFGQFSGGPSEERAAGTYLRSGCHGAKYTNIGAKNVETHSALRQITPVWENQQGDSNYEPYSQ